MIKHFPAHGVGHSFEGTLTLNVLKPLELLFLDPISPEGEEKVELDMKVYKDGQEYQCTKLHKKANRRALNKGAKAHTFDMDISPVVDEADQSVNMTLKEMKVISNSLARK